MNVKQGRKSSPNSPILFVFSCLVSRATTSYVPPDPNPSFYSKPLLEFCLVRPNGILRSSSERLVAFCCGGFFASLFPPTHPRRSSLPFQSSRQWMSNSQPQPFVLLPTLLCLTPWYLASANSNWNKKLLIC